MNINFYIETILILFAILASNGIIYSLTFFNLNKPNSSENISVIKNNSEKDGLALTSLIASNPISVTSSDSSESQTLSVTSSDSSASQTLSVTSSETNVSQTWSFTSSETNVSQDMLDSGDWIDTSIPWGTPNETVDLLIRNGDLLPTNLDANGNITPVDSSTILDAQRFEDWRQIAMDLQEHPFNTPAGILQQIKFEEINILYSQDIINFCITQTELRLIIEHLPAISLFNPDINHFILIIMSHYHF